MRQPILFHLFCFILNWIALCTHRFNSNLRTPSFLCINTTFALFGYFLRIISVGYFSDLDGFIYSCFGLINFPIFSYLDFFGISSGRVQMYFRKKSENASVYDDCW